MKVRTIYFKSKQKNILSLKNFYSSLFNIQPKTHKNNPEEWIEFDFGNINLGILPIDDDKWSSSNCVPVFEFSADVVAELKKSVIQLGGKIIVEDYDGFVSAVCEDPLGNEFEITSFHD